MVGSCYSVFRPPVSALCSWDKRTAPRATPPCQAAAAIAGDVCRTCEPVLQEVLPQGKHNMAVPEVARDALAAAWQMVQCPGGAGTVLGGSQASGGEGTQEKVRFIF